MKKLVYFLPLIVLFYGCFATMPDPIKDEYLKNRSDAESKRLSEIEKEVITFNRDKEKIEKEVKIYSQKVVVAKKEIEINEITKKQLEDKLKLYTMSNDQKSADDVKIEIEKNDKELNLSKLKYDYLSSKSDYLEKSSESKQAELNVKVAELNLEKAKIARAYQENRLSASGKDPKEAEKERANFIDTKEYDNYYTKMKDNLSEKNERLKKSTQMMEDSKKKLADAGFTQEI